MNNDDSLQGLGWLLMQYGWIMLNLYLKEIEAALGESFKSKLEVRWCGVHPQCLQALFLWQTKPKYTK